MEAAGARIGMVHVPGLALGRSERLLDRFPELRRDRLRPHASCPVLERVEDVWLLNPGSPTERRRAPVRTMLELTVEGGEIAPRLVDLGT